MRRTGGLAETPGALPSVPFMLRAVFRPLSAVFSVMLAGKSAALGVTFIGGAVPAHRASWMTEITRAGPARSAAGSRGAAAPCRIRLQAGG